MCKRHPASTSETVRTGAAIGAIGGEAGAEVGGEAGTLAGATGEDTVAGATGGGGGGGGITVHSGGGVLGGGGASETAGSADAGAGTGTDTDGIWKNAVLLMRYRFPQYSLGRLKTTQRRECRGGQPSNAGHSTICAEPEAAPECGSGFAVGYLTKSSLLCWGRLQVAVGPQRSMLARAGTWRTGGSAYRQAACCLAIRLEANP